MAFPNEVTRISQLVADFFRTAEAPNKRIEIDNAVSGQQRFYTGDAQETAPADFDTNVSTINTDRVFAMRMRPPGILGIPRFSSSGIALFNKIIGTANRYGAVGDTYEEIQLVSDTIRWGNSDIGVGHMFTGRKISSYQVQLGPLTNVPNNGAWYTVYDFTSGQAPAGCNYMHIKLNVTGKWTTNAAGIWQTEYISNYHTVRVHNNGDPGINCNTIMDMIVPVYDQYPVWDIHTYFQNDPGSGAWMGPGWGNLQIDFFR